MPTKFPKIFIKAIEFPKLDLDGVLGFVTKNHDCQVVNQSIVFGEKHIIHSVYQALKAFRSGRGLAHYEGMEFLLRVSAERQITKAVKLCEPRKRSVFVSWSPKAKEKYSGFRKRFKVKESKLKEYPKEKVLEAMEKTAVFPYVD